VSEEEEGAHRKFSCVCVCVIGGDVVLIRGCSAAQQPAARRKEAAVVHEVQVVLGKWSRCPAAARS
jgi:hypothetical protein